MTFSIFAENDETYNIILGVQKIKGLRWQNNKLGLILFGFSPKESKIPYQLDVVNFISQMVLSCNSTILIDI